MLGKLFKHEFRETAKLLVPMNLALLLLAFAGKLLLMIDGLEGIISVFQSFIVIVYTLTIFALFILTAVYLTVRFYKTMYASQGYLTHTLPASTISILNVKILTAVFWLITAVLMTVFSLYVLGHTGGGFDAVRYNAIREEIKTSTGMYAWEFWLLLAAMVITICFSLALAVCASLSVGQLFHRHRIPAAIVAYIVFYIIQQTVSVIMLAYLGISQTNSTEQIVNQISTTAMTAPIGFVQQVFSLAIIQAVVFGVIYYSICFYITKKQLNLE